ncbi:MAG: BatA domain-containing protein, partial [Chromatiales bacterium]|nr:BatA domain-containing protein [Chromatiales bacterium]
MVDWHFHFAAPHWLWALLLIPVIAIWVRRNRPRNRDNRLEAYADPHLLPYLTGQHEQTPQSNNHLLRWSLLWLLLCLALAGPRWDARQINLFT